MQQITLFDLFGEKNTEMSFLWFYFCHCCRLCEDSFYHLSSSFLWFSAWHLIDIVYFVNHFGW